MESSTPPVAGGSYNYSPSSISDGEDFNPSPYDAAYVAWRAVFAVILVCGLAANCGLVVHTLRGHRRIGSREPPQINLFVVAIHAAANIVNWLADGVWFVYMPASDPKMNDLD